MRVVADQDIPYLRGVLEPFAEVVYRPGRAIAPADVADADALLVRTRTVCNAALLQHSRVRFIASATIGFDHIDSSTDVAKVSVIGIGMRSHAGVAAQAFRALAEKQINIRAITTSEIKFSLLIDAAYTELAVRTLHSLYGLDK